MGQEISAIRKELELADEENKQEKMQRLQILEKMVIGRLEQQKHSILAGERNDEEIHAGTIVSMDQQICIKQSEGTSQDLDKSINDFFSEDLAGGFQSLLKLGANAILGNEAMGEYEMKDMFIIWNANALLRCDAYCYRWNLVSKGVIDGVEGIIGVLLVKRVIDMTQTDPQVLTWAITTQRSKVCKTERDVTMKDGNEETMKVIDSAIAVLKKVATFQMELKQIESGVPVPKEEN